MSYLHRMNLIITWLPTFFNPWVILMMESPIYRSWDLNPWSSSVADVASSSVVSHLVQNFIPKFSINFFTSDNKSSTLVNSRLRIKWIILISFCLCCFSYKELLIFSVGICKHLMVSHSPSLLLGIFITLGGCENACNSDFQLYATWYLRDRLAASKLL